MKVNNLDNNIRIWYEPKRQKVKPSVWHIIRLWHCNTLQSGVTGDVSGHCWKSLLFMTEAIWFFPPGFVSSSFISGSIRSYYPSWNDFSRDIAIPRELSLPTATQSIPNWTGPWFIENPLLQKKSQSAHTKHTDTHTLKSPSAQGLQLWIIFVISYFISLSRQKKAAEKVLCHFDKLGKES